jgi:hypothetical protein
MESSPPNVPGSGRRLNPTSFLVELSERFALQHNVARFVRQTGFSLNRRLVEIEDQLRPLDFMTVAFEVF